MKKQVIKMLQSFNDSITKKFEKDIKVINAKSAAIRNMVSQSSRAEIRATRLTLEELGRDVRIGLEGEARHRAEMRDVAARLERDLLNAQFERRMQSEELLGRLTSTLEQFATAYMREQRAKIGQSDESRA